GTPDAWAGSRTMTLAPTLAATWRRGPLLADVEIGARVRGEEPLANAVTGSQLVAALGAAYDVLSRDRLTLSAEAFALPTLASQGPTVVAASTGTPALVPAEWIASVSTAPWLGGDVSFALGGGGPIPFTKGALGEPRFRLDLAVRYAPTGRDSDGDGIPDARDKCPNEPEDKDGFQDADGCPDPDNDRDGIPDARDKCPNEPEDFNGFEDADGCPDRGRRPHAEHGAHAP
ncbi:MAG TPA: hypothetical protein VHB21_26795, partial [Minicystis sp.]|nr:hypothetical protein [Minicystis sp.]